MASKGPGAVQPERFEREHLRYAHEATITVLSDGKRYEGKSSNVSRGGVCADMETAVPMGADVEVDLQLVFDEETHSEALRLKARVVWCTTVDDGFQIGLSFKPLDAARNEYLTMFLRYLDDGTSPRPPKRQPSIDDRFG